VDLRINHEHEIEFCQISANALLIIVLFWWLIDVGKAPLNALNASEVQSRFGFQETRRFDKLQIL